jgi:hypothetical protein
MTTIKSFTDLEQSKILEKILPPESADSVIVTFGTREGTETVVMPNKTLDIISDPFSDIRETVHCWSLAALLDILPDSIYDNTYEYSQLEFSKKSVAYHDLNDGIKIGSLKDNLIDACVAMIIKLHEQKLL